MAERPEHVLLRCSDVQAMLSVARSQVYDLMKTSGFPRPLRIGSQSVRWRKSDVVEWIDARPEAGSESSG